jgi:hypothetical protein
VTTLLLGRDEDPCCRLVQEQLLHAGRDVWFLPEDQLFPDLRLTWTPSSAGRDGLIDYRSRQVRFAEVGGVLCRFYGIPISPEDFDTADGQYISAEWNALLMAWLPRMACRVVNRLRPELWYKQHLNVPDLASLVPGIRFKRPRTLVTTVIDEARAFWRSVPGAVRYSPLTQPARYRIETEEDWERLAALEGSLPFHLTEWIEGRALDALVIGSAVVPIDPHGGSDGEIPVTVETHCVEIGAALGLDFFRLSLVHTIDSDWYCLGLDRTPQLYGYAPEDQMRIAGSLARLLTVGEDRP